ncbi:MAG: helix-turn-helix transcriptional regulator [Proteobacteria bacterium]|nr:helix-turn-helix transcriptional regulator [Pseudomonadota bacterium]
MSTAPKRKTRSRLGKPHIGMGARIQHRRKQLGLTLSELGARAGLSAPFLSQAERNHTVPSIMSLMALAKALQVDLQYFLESPTERSIVCRARERPRIRINSPVAFYDLSSSLIHRMMDAILMEIPPGHAFPTDQRDGEEFVMVLKGRLHSRVGEIETVLGPGDSLHFNSQLPHSSRNDTNTTVTLLYVGTPSVIGEEPREG